MMNTTQIPLFDTELKELQGKIHCLKFDIKGDINSLKNKWKKEPAASGYKFSQKKYTNTELREEMKKAYCLMLKRLDYYFEKWIDKRDLEKEK